MATTAFLVLGAFAIIAVCGLGWAREWEKRLSLEHDLACSETARLQWEAYARRLRAERATRLPGILKASEPDVLPGDPDSKLLGGAS